MIRSCLINLVLLLMVASTYSLYQTRYPPAKSYDYFMMAANKVKDPELDAGSGAGSSSGGRPVLDKKGNPLGPFNLSTRTPQTSTPSGRGARKVNGLNQEQERKGDGERSGPPVEKRKEREGDVKESGKRRKESRIVKGPKLTFAEATRGLEAVEIRSSTGTDYLSQADFEIVESQLMFRFAMIEPKPCFKYGVKRVGCSQGGVWVACEGQLTVDYVMQTVPDLQSPIGCNYTYRVFAPGTKPFIYYKGRFPKRMWCEPQDLIKLIKRMNWDLDFKVDVVGQEESDEEILEKVQMKKDVHMRISSGMRDPAKDIKFGYFTAVIECDDRIAPYIIAQNGILNFGATQVELYGAGLDKAIQDEKEKEKQMEIERENERQLAEERSKDTPWEEEGDVDQVNDTDG